MIFTAAKTDKTHTHTLLTGHREGQRHFCAFYRVVLFVWGQGTAILPRLSSNNPPTSSWQDAGMRLHPCQPFCPCLLAQEL